MSGIQSKITRYAKKENRIKQEENGIETFLELMTDVRIRRKGRWSSHDECIQHAKKNLCKGITNLKKWELYNALGKNTMNEICKLVDVTIETSHMKHRGKKIIKKRKEKQSV